MTRTITVKGRTGLFDTPSFPLSENEALTLNFSFPEEIRAGRYCVVVRHGEAARKTFILSSDKSVTLPAEWLREGGTENIEFSLCLQNATGSAVIKDDYIIEPLKVETVGGNFTATPIIREMQAEIETLKESIRELQDGYKALEEIVSGIPEEIEEAKREAIVEAAGGDPMGA